MAKKTTLDKITELVAKDVARIEASADIELTTDDSFRLARYASLLLELDKAMAQNEASILKAAAGRSEQELINFMNAKQKVKK